MSEKIEPFEDTTALRNEIIEACLFLCKIGFCIGTWGNISVRVEKGLLITPTRVDYDTMTPDDLVLVDWEGKILSEGKLPSSEMQLHRLLLLRRPDMAVVVHSHSPYASSVAAAGRSIPVCVDDMAQIIGDEVECASYVPGGRHFPLAEAACEAIGDISAAVLLMNHGPVVLGRNLHEAVVASQVLEKSAMMLIFAESIGGCKSIPEDMVKEERYRYLYKYGRKEDAE